jgi:deoxyribodipyrimidine photo-lyase
MEVTRDGMHAWTHTRAHAQDTSQLSSDEFLDSAGCISPRYVAAKCKEYEEKRGIKNKSTYWVVWELTVRDFFRFLCVKYGNKVFFQGGIADSNWRWLSDKEGFRRWVDGTTGQPLVDANMRELKETGFMSNRGRQNVASYLTQVI